MNPTMDDIRELALSDPVVRHFLKAAEMGHCSREQALIGMVLFLAEEKRSHIRQRIDHAMKCPMSVMDNIPELRTALPTPRPPGHPPMRG